MKLGIGVITYNRINHLKNCIERIQKFTTIPHVLIVVDDGSPDGSADWCTHNGIAVISGKNRGVVWNKNRAIYAFMQCTDVDCFVLLEEDCWPSSKNWAQQWYDAASRWHHINFAHPRTIVAKGSSVIKSGAGTPSDPYRATLVTGQCTGCSRHGIEIVGYLDSRFRGYGFGHVEWTRRFLRAGLGKKKSDEPSIYLSITGGLEPHDAPTNCSPQELERNKQVSQEVSSGSIYRQPWHNEAEKLLLIAEVNPIRKFKFEGYHPLIDFPSRATIKIDPLRKYQNMTTKYNVNIIKLVTSESQDLVRCALDSPLPGSVLERVENLNLKGWVFGSQSEAVSVEVLSDGRIIKAIPVCQSRPDVAKAFPKYESAKNSGFASEISGQDFSIEAGILIQAVLKDNSKIPIYLFRFEPNSDFDLNPNPANVVQPKTASDRPVPVLQAQQVRQIVLNEYKQIEALLNLHSLIPLTHPLPPLRGWAISPDFAIALYSLILERKIQNVLELGSGSSSLIVGYALQKLGGGGQLISLEHDSNYAIASKQLVSNHQLDRYCQIHHAPLKPTEINGQNYKFYSLDCLKQTNLKFDLLIVDGPPSYTNPLARFPAVPLLYEYLTDEAIVCLDDGDRKDEKLAVKKWLQEYGMSKTMTSPTTEKGMSVLKKKGDKFNTQ